MRVDLGTKSGAGRPPWRRLLLALIALAVVLITILLLVVLQTIAVMGREAKTHRIAWLEARRSETAEALDAYRQAEREAAGLTIDPAIAEGDPESLDRNLTELQDTIATNRAQLEETMVAIDRRIAHWHDTGDLAAGLDRDLQTWHSEQAEPSP